MMALTVGLVVVEVITAMVLTELAHKELTVEMEARIFLTLEVVAEVVPLWRVLAQQMVKAAQAAREEIVLSQVHRCRMQWAETGVVIAPRPA